jgi:6-phosphogluconolactonase
MTGCLHFYKDAEILSNRAADFFAHVATAAITKRGAFHVAFAGGSTPKRLYQILASEQWATVLDWRHIHIYFGDERCVPPDHEDSNYLMASRALLDHIDIPAENIHRIQGELADAAQGAQAYAQELDEYLPKLGTLPEFDLVLLGMGDDGHTASLFPGTEALHVTDKTVTAVYVDKLSAWRNTLTFPVINNARYVLLLIAGQGKAETIKQVFAGGDASRFPVQQLNPNGVLDWYLDDAAAEQLLGEFFS